MKVYEINAADTPAWIKEDHERMMQEHEDRHARIYATVVERARASMELRQTLRERVAEMICNERHSGFDLWSSLDPEVRAHWLTEADMAVAAYDRCNRRTASNV